MPALIGSDTVLQILRCRTGALRPRPRVPMPRCLPWEDPSTAKILMASRAQGPSDAPLTRRRRRDERERAGRLRRYNPPPTLGRPGSRLADTRELDAALLHKMAAPAGIKMQNDRMKRKHLDHLLKMLLDAGCVPEDLATIEALLQRTEEGAGRAARSMTPGAQGTKMTLNTIDIDLQNTKGSSFNRSIFTPASCRCWRGWCSFSSFSTPRGASGASRMLSTETAGTPRRASCSMGSVRARPALNHRRACGAESGPCTTRRQRRIGWREGTLAAGKERRSKRFDRAPTTRSARSLQATRGPLELRGHLRAQVRGPGPLEVRAGVPIPRSLHGARAGTPRGAPDNPLLFVPFYGTEGSTSNDSPELGGDATPSPPLLRTSPTSPHGISIDVLVAQAHLHAATPSFQEARERGALDQGRPRQPPLGTCFGHRRHMGGPAPEEASMAPGHRAWASERRTASCGCGRTTWGPPLLGDEVNWDLAFGLP